MVCCLISVPVYCFQVSKVGEVLRALGQNPTESEVKRLVQSSCKVRKRKKENIMCSKRENERDRGR